MSYQIGFYFFLFLTAGLLSAIFTVLAKKISLKYGFYDDPGKDSLKIHKMPIPFLGGAAVLGSFLLCLILVWLFKPGHGIAFDNSALIAIFVGSVIAWFYGFWDDTYWQDRKKIKQSAKIFLQIPIVLILALIFYNAQIKYQFFGLSLFGIFLAALCFLFIENATNLQDGLDGLASGIIFISSAAFFIFFVFSQNLFAASVCVIISGALFSFLFFNWNPASIFLGNNGSYFLGFLMVVLAIMSSQPGRFFYSFVPYLLIGAPIFNVFYVFAKRGAVGRSFFSADRSHLHDDLFKATKSVTKSVVCIYFMHLVFVALGLFIIFKLK
ncbi:MAG: MraY family glycosyltransferase [Candidatus Staskawiczbacteria bacterium]|nr:MraY family glycosyltransferase [Candidatus Staskawiczbacteria bacterium]